MKRRYCEMCDKWVSARQRQCRACGASTSKALDYCAACDREGATAGGDTTALEFHTCQRQSPYTETFDEMSARIKAECIRDEVDESA